MTLSGWFDSSTTLDRVQLPLVAECGKCQLHKGCLNPFMPVRGKGKRKILVIGEAPGVEEDERNKPFVGKTGRRLQAELDEVGIDLFKDCWVINAARCRPKQNLLPNQTVDYCRPNVVKDIQDLKPEIIILVGGVAARSVINWCWKENVGSLTKQPKGKDPLARWLNWKIPCQKINSWICPIWHPSFVEREDNKALDLLWHKQLEGISQLSGRPWKKVPDFASKIEIVLDHKEAALILNTFKKGRVSYDFETDTKVPYSKEASIVYCSACWEGKRTIAFCWYGEARKSFLDLVRRRDVWMSSWNGKYDRLWLMVKEGVDVRNHDVDGMLESHLLCNMPGTKSLKFQSFVRKGQESYDQDIKPYLQSKGNSRNRIREFDKIKALRYCGMDSLLDYKLKRIMEKEINGGPNHEEDWC